MDVELIEIREFLAGHPPFDRLSDDALDELPRELSVRYLRRGTPFPPRDADGDYLYLVRQGAVELRDHRGDLLIKYGEGDFYASPCLADNPAAGFQGATAEDTLLYLLPCATFRSLCQQHPAFNDHFNQSIRERLRRALDALQQAPAACSGLLAVTVAELLVRPAVHVAPETPIHEAARVMSRERVSALLIMEQERLLGIVTDRDLRSRAIAEGRPLETAIAEIMTRKLHKVSPETPAFEALIIMMRLNIHHLPVVGRGGVMGVISTTDLVRQQSANAVYLIGDVHKCESVEALAEVSKELPELQVQMMAAGATAYHLGQAVSSVTDAITARLLELAEHKHGAPPVPYAWLACGSQARHEQTTHSDQDNALLIADEAQPQDAPYFEAVARFVNDGLKACGFEYCPGEVMASTPKWRQPYRVWQGYFDKWINEPERKALMHSSIFFDMRVVYGDEGLGDRLRAHILHQTRENGIFLAHLTANALHNRPPLGFFRNFVLVHDGEHDRTLDLKHRGVIPVTDLARVYALSAGLPEINTVDRLRAAAETVTVSPEGAANLADAFEFMATLRARHQADQIRRGEIPDNYIDPEEISKLERSHLKDAFSAIRVVQSALAQRYQTERIV